MTHLELTYMCILIILIAVYLMPLLTLPLLLELWPNLNGNLRFLVCVCEIWWAISCVVFILAVRMMIKRAELIRMVSLFYPSWSDR
ncbi:hypothetical protein BO78DRAFT_193805 [Aspergillus sclerotiicarbonarius CBS 121057]|uniref:Uncharacterized protein n=1 Tax=Aspergillus sclerotiicarbonarius (strain CBS 121057 / IBT 28362) TaxID=1448318 RepID=A0A319ERP2_ASPSB|nr:hypothetical protein BO78DRAFT_193805 [Aspergillus sclerotiicarbonarius CBS 121057]